MKKGIGITSAAAFMMIFQSILLTVGCLLAATIFFKNSITAIYEELDSDITSAAIASADKQKVNELCENVNAVFRSFSEDGLPKSEDIEGYNEAFAEIENSKTYKEVWEAFNSLRSNTSATSLDLVLMYPEDNIGVYVMDASDVDVISCGHIFTRDMSKTAEDPSKDLDGFISHSKYYGSVRTDGVSVYVNYDTGTYAFLTADIPMSRVVENTNLFLTRSAFFAAVITAVICALVAIGIRRGVTNPVKAMADTAEKFVGDYEKRFDSHDESHIFEKVDGGKIHELRELSTSLQSMELEMNSYVRNLNALTEEKARISAELGLASRIQLSMLPGKFPVYPDRTDFDIYAFMKPAKEVGGDFYDFFLIDEDHIGLVMADVSGKGIPAALFMVITKTLIENRVLGGDSPAQALTNVNEQICNNNDNNMFVTVWLATINLKTGKGIAVNAGHEHPYIRRKDGKYELVKYRHGVAVGTMDGIVYKEHEFEINRGDSLFVYTDGATEATASGNVLFGNDRLTESLNADPDADPQFIIQNVKSDIDDFVGTAPQFDDLTLLAFKRY